MMSIAHAYASAWKRGFSFKGRTTRSDFWWGYSVVLFLLLCLRFFYDAVLDSMLYLAWSKHLELKSLGASEYEISKISLFDNSTLTSIYIVTIVIFLIVLVYSMSLLSRRLHDTNRSAFWILIGFIPFGIFVVWVFCMFKGTDGDNQYGTDPNADSGLNPNESMRKASELNKDFEEKLKTTFTEQR